MFQWFYLLHLCSPRQIVSIIFLLELQLLGIKLKKSDNQSEAFITSVTDSLPQKNRSSERSVENTPKTLVLFL